MPRYARHLYREGPANPFPGLKALERKLGRSIPHRLGSNEGLDMPHHALKARFGEAVAELARSYGDAEALGVRRRLAEALDTPVEALLVDAGADSLLALALRATCEPGDTVITSAGTYPTFRYFAAGQGCRVVEVDYRRAPGRLAPDLAALAEHAHQHHARLVYLANPDNPSGHCHDDEAVQALRDALPAECTLLLDEAYHDFRGDADAPAAGAVWPGVIRVRTFSKAHGLAGLRIGYAIADPGALAMLHKVRIHYAVSSLALAAAETVLDHPGETREHVEAVVRRREQLAERLRGLGAEVPPSDTNFIAVCLPDAETAERVHGELLAAAVLIHRPAHPALGDVLRISTLADALPEGRLAALEAVLPGR
ncbi:aminotransferase class I/II-fold pyridoxal phosphate-dependent enzyme [Modicisalibacter tunisiensis]|uniref:histidinol-phosphate transaminase n=1 Tax=Modicisalibacter tunisiensis TaxID=390637 RepID=A0ABS7WVW2_9GAMM|nr:aminotransferase class I/II-fold pyridoxal phosphate-dependent enzyme [Modicisalibacter tunisiensis]MBZ9566740.1 aminotransferase class I/II-fold pyridoxal phosphate-dependent enzyme [Modicisalibacter tunisiensis]